MISLKKLIADNETEQALMRVIQILLQGIGLHTMEGDPDDYTRFRHQMDQVLQHVEEAATTTDLVIQAKAALSALELQNRRALSYLRQPTLELQEMVKMLTSTIGAISASGNENNRRLREIENQVESASLIEDVRLIRAKLGECLAEIRREAERQRSETHRTVENLRQGLSESSRSRRPAVDQPTGLPARRPAEEALDKSCGDSAPAYVLVVQIDRIHIFNARFGYAVGDEIMRYVAGFLRPQLAGGDLLFRWNAAAFVGLLFRDHDLDRVRDEIGRIMEFKYEHTVQLASRTVLLPISARWSVFPLPASRVTACEQIDRFSNA